MPSLPPLTWIRTFEAAARLESFSAAATELALTQPAVSQHIRQLEATLERQLFRRLRHGVQLTADGVAYLPHVQAALAGLTRATRDLFGADAPESVSIAAPASISALWLAPRLDALRAAHPGIAVTVASVYRPVDYETVGADIEIRFGEGDWPQRTALPLMAEELSPVAAPGLLASAADDDWTQLPAIAVTGPRAGWTAWSRVAGVAPPSRIVIRFDSFLPALEAARAGAGMLLASLPLAHGALGAGDVQRLSEVVLTVSGGHWVTYAPEAPSAVVAVAQWLADARGHASTPSRGEME